MPRIVNHEQRRAELAQVGIKLLIENGIDAITVRGVAAAAGWSTGSLRHYFSNQRELQEYVVAAASEELFRRVLPRVQGPRDADSPVGAVALVVEELLPLDDNRREEYALWSAVVEWESRNQDLSSRTWQQQRSLYRQAIAALRGQASAQDPESAMQPHADPVVEDWASVLHTFTDGLASQLTLTPGERTPQDARRLLRILLAAVPGSRGPVRDAK